MRLLLCSLLAISGLHAAACCDPPAASQSAAAAEIGVADLQSQIAAKSVTIIDVNGSDSFKAGHIPGAIDFAAKKDELAKLLPADKSALVVAYCGGPACTAWKQGAEAAAKLGYTNIKHLKAGISGWKKAGAAVETVN